MPDYFKAIVDGCHDVRVVKADPAETVRELVIEKGLADALFARPFKSSKWIKFSLTYCFVTEKCGRAVRHLMMKPDAMIKPRKPTKKYKPVKLSAFAAAKSGGNLA